MSLLSAYIRTLHKGDMSGAEPGRWCGKCDFEMPCDAIQAADELDAQLAQLIGLKSVRRGELEDAFRSGFNAANYKWGPPKDVDEAWAEYAEDIRRETK